MNYEKIKTKMIFSRKILIWSVVTAFIAALALGTSQAEPEKTTLKVEDNNNTDAEKTELVLENSDNSGTSVEKDGEEGFKFIGFQKDTTIKSALQIIAARYEKNIIPASEVSGKLTFTKLFDVSFDEAMNAILGDEYTYEQKGNIVKVYKKTNPNRMQHKIFTLYYINATEAKKIITPLLSKAGKIESSTASKTGVPTSESISSNQGDGGDNPAMNDTIIVYDYPEELAKIEKIIDGIDQRPMQVLVEAAILSVSLTEGMELGVDWQTLSDGADPNINGLTSLTKGTSDYIKSEGGSQVSTSGGFTLGIIRGNIGSFIRAVERVTDVTLMANPKILAVNKQLGQVYIGKKLGYESVTQQYDTGTTSSEVKFLDTGTKLSFRPYIGNDGYIRMDIHPKDSSGELNDSGVPDETSAELITNIMVKDEQTVVIGGLFRDKLTTTKRQIPILGDIPIIGNLFKGTSDSIKRQEVMVLLTPHIIEKPSEVEGEKRQDDYERIKYGTYKGLHGIGRTKISNDCYKRAVKYYDNEEYEEAIAELDTALRIHPTHIEALRLRDEIMQNTRPEEFSRNERILMEDIEERLTPNWEK